MTKGRKAIKSGHDLHELWLTSGLWIWLIAHNCPVFKYVRLEIGPALEKSWIRHWSLMLSKRFLSTPFHCEFNYSTFQLRAEIQGSQNEPSHSIIAWDGRMYCHRGFFDHLSLSLWSSLVGVWCVACSDAFRLFLSCSLALQMSQSIVSLLSSSVCLSDCIAILSIDMWSFNKTSSTPFPIIRCNTNSPGHKHLLVNLITGISSNFLQLQGKALHPSTPRNPGCFFPPLSLHSVHWNGSFSL